MDVMKKFFGVIARGQTYLNALYLLLAFPLGIFYLVFLVTGLALGVSLLILWIGLLILVAVFAAWYALAAFERQMAIWLLREDIAPMTRSDQTGLSLWQSFVAALRNPVTWKGLFYLFAKFPLGVVSFVVLVTLLSISVTMLATPFYYQWADVSFAWVFQNWQPAGRVDTLGEAMAISLIGALFTLVSMHVINGLAWVSGKFARMMLGSSQATTTPTPPTAPTNLETPALNA